MKPRFFVVRLVALASAVGVFVTTGGSVAFAQATTPAPAPVPVVGFRDSVVVTPERGEAPQSWIPAATVNVDAASLGTLPAVTFGEFLSFVPGFRVQQSSLSAGRPVVSARGFFGGGEAEYVALLVDGVRVADAESGLVDWSSIAASSVTRIEAARGPGASLYGDAAIGGVIQVLTDSPANRATLTASGGSLRTFDIDGTSRWSAPSLGGFIAGAARRTDGIADHSDTSEFTLGGAVNGKAGPVSLRWTANLVHRDQEEPGPVRVVPGDDAPSFDPLFRFDTRNRRTLLTALTARSAGSSWSQQSRVSVDARDEDGIRTILLAPGLADSRGRELSTAGVAASVEGERTLGAAPNSALRFGIDLIRQHLDTSYRGVIGGEPAGSVLSRAEGTRVRAGAFASASWMPLSRVRLFGALRWDHIGDSDFGRPEGDSAMEAWSPRVGVVVQPEWLRGASLFGQVSRAFKAPTLDQMFDPRPYPDFRGGTFTVSNPSLAAQRASNFEAGLSGGNRVRWSVLGYRMNVTNEIDFDTRTFSYANIGRSRHVGVEAEVSAAATSRIRPTVTYVLSDVSPEDSPDSGQLKNVPRHQLLAGATVSLPWKVDAFASVRRAWDAFLDDENTMPIRTGPLVDLRVRRAVRQAVLFMDVLNLTDERYDEFGFVLTGFRGELVPYAYPGQPRVVRVGLTLDVK